jgi:hypothetical protein
MKSFMKHSYASYFIQLASGEYVTASRADCLRFDKDNPDKLQRWLARYPPARSAASSRASQPRISASLNI